MKLPKITKWLRCLLIVCYFIDGNTCTAQKIFQFGIEHGLSNNGVSSIYQDHNGFMWFGTFDGLNRFDGTQFTIFRNQLSDTNSLVFSRISAIAEDADFNLWIGTQKGISILDPVLHKFSNVYYVPTGQQQPQRLTDVITQIKIDDNGVVFVGTEHTGLILFQKNSNTGIQVNGTKNYKIIAFDFDSSKTLWVFVRGIGLCRYNYKGSNLQLVNNQIINGTHFKAASENGEFYLATNDATFKYTKASNSFTEITALSGKNISRMVVMKNKDIWMASDGNGIFSLSPTNNAKVTALFTGHSENTLSSQTVYDICEDRQGRTWIATLRGGINMTDPQKNLFTTVIHDPLNSNSLADNFIFSFCEDRLNNVWIGMDGGGLSYWDRGKNSFINYRSSGNSDNLSLSSNFITSIVNDADDNIWMATWNGGINLFDKKTGRFKHYSCYNSETKAYDKNIWRLCEDRKKRLWATSFNYGNGGLYLFNKTNNTFELFDAQLNDMMALAEDESGNLFGGGIDGIVKIDAENRQHKSYSIGKKVLSILNDKKGRIWVGTEGGGLLLFDRLKDSFKTYSTNDGLSNNTVLNILEDKEGSLWLSTYNGLSRFNPDTKRFVNYTVSDGLQSNQFNYNAALTLQSGEMMFGGIKGFNIFYPENIQSAKTSPQVFITDITVDSKPIEKNINYVKGQSLSGITEIEIPYNKTNISFSFVTPEYTAPDKIKYAYFLAESDKEENYTVTNKTINFTNLKEGRYIFNIKASNTDGIWSDKVHSLAIVVLPPWYRTWWAYLLYLTIISAAVYSYIKYREQKNRLMVEATWAKQEIEKEKELNEKKLNFFTNICHEFRTPLSLIIAPIKKLRAKDEQQENDQELNVVYRNARRLLSLTNQILLFRKADSNEDVLQISRANLVHLANEVFACFAQESAIRDIKYALHASNECIEIDADVEKLEIVLFNLISNAFKFTQNGGKIDIGINENEKSVEIIVEDNGCGISSNAPVFEKFKQATSGKNPKSGFGIGLYLVKKFVEDHQGSVSYTSKENEGTRFYVQLPKISQYPIDKVVTSVPFKKPAIIDELLQEPELPKQMGRAEIENEQNEKITRYAERPTMLIADDDEDSLVYLKLLFEKKFIVFSANNGNDAYESAQKNLPDIIISDVRMGNTNGIELCQQLRRSVNTDTTPVILLTGSDSTEMQLEGIESGANYYMTKPFNPEILAAQVDSILKTRNNLKQYFINSIILKENTVKVSQEYRDFLTRCIEIVEAHIDADEFSVKTFCKAIGMSHSKLYAQIKLISGQTINAFIRSIRLRRAAILMLKEDIPINQAAFQVGIADIKYFRQEFNKLFGMNPSDYVKRYRKHFNREFTIIKPAD
jgi:signal transduction histidine kinase/ligand-binding sensor domain-containing protein/DNA-binding response OmpR family regulator